MQFDSRKGETREMRQDLITGQWVVIATGRAKRPHDTLAHRKPHPTVQFKADCPFCNLDKFPQGPDIVRLPDDLQRWQVHIFNNKYPALVAKDELRSWRVGPYRATNAVGYHELLAMRAHDAIEGRLTLQQFKWQVEALLTRFRQLKTKQSVNYVQIFKNYRPEAGQSLEHPHHQIITLPVLPSDVQEMLSGAERFAQDHQREVFDVALDYEHERGERVVWQNDFFTAFCPFASRISFEVWIVPHRSNPFFDQIEAAEREALAEILQQVMRRLYQGLQDPPYNYYIHSAPCDDTGFVCRQDQFLHFRWHLQILPRLNLWGGFELGTGLEIVTTWPEEAAEFLRSQKVIVS